MSLKLTATIWKTLPIRRVWHGKAEHKGGPEKGDKRWEGGVWKPTRPTEDSVFSTPAGQTNRVHFGTNTNFDKVQTSWRLVGGFGGGPYRMHGGVERGNGVYGGGESKVELGDTGPNRNMLETQTQWRKFPYIGGERRRPDRHMDVTCTDYCHFPLQEQKKNYLFLPEIVYLFQDAEENI